MNVFHHKQILFCICIIILSIFVGTIDSREWTRETEGFDSQHTNIIGYIHVCQKGEWRRSYDMLMSSIKDSGLYENTKEIRLGVVSDDAKLIPDKRFDDPKLRIIYVGYSKEYERPTLLHMKKSSRVDPENTRYFYLHTKGLRWYGTKHENKVMEWIQSMLDCNITKWKRAIKELNTNETYGRDYNGTHYSGNFWWTTRNHVQKLSDVIPEYYTAPEDWILTNKDGMHCAENCGGKYVASFNSEMYA